MAAPAATPDERPFPTLKHCYDTWQANKGLGFRELSKLLEGQGFRCSYQWLQRQKDAYRPWLEAYTIFRTESVSPERVMATLEIAQKAAKDLDSLAFQGVQARLVARLFEEIDMLPVPDAETWERLLDCVPKLVALMHNHRGAEVGEGKGKTGDKGSLVAQFGPRPVIKPITTTGGTA